MTLFKLGYFVFILILFLFGCGTQLALSGQEREDYLKSIKSYGEYFVKPGVSRDEWKKDWVACGGMADGGFSSDAPSGSPTDILINASKQKRKNLAACMKFKNYDQLKGFEY